MALHIQHWRLLTLVISALSLGPSFAHVLEAYPRLSLWAPYNVVLAYRARHQRSYNYAASAGGRRQSSPACI
jgi:hypothetical protein